MKSIHSQGSCVRTALVSALVSISAAGLAAAQGPGGGAVFFGGHGFGSHATLGNTVLVGKSAPVSLGCAGGSAENTAVGVEAPPVLSTGTVSNSVGGSVGIGLVTSETVAEVEGVSLLNGLVTAALVRARSEVSRSGQLFAVSADGSALVDVRVAGIPIVGDVPPNTQINLAGFGHVTLNEQDSQVSPRSAVMRVKMIHVEITLPNPLLPVGTEIVVASAMSKLTSGAGELGGNAHGSTANLLQVAHFGPSAQIGMPCNGTRGALRENSITGLSIPLVLDAGTVRNTAQGLSQPTFAVGELTSTVEGLDLLDGLVTAGLLRASAQALKEDGVRHFGSEGTEFVNLQVAGFPTIDDSVPPNTHLTIPGLGSLWLKRVIQGQNSITVRMIELLVLEDNPLGLPIGSRVRVGVATASVR